MTRYLLTLSALLLGLLLSGCNGSASGSAAPISERPIRAVVTTGMVGDVVRNVGGERVEITQLMQAGVDPHLYKASEGDVQRLADADIIFYNGLHLEARLTDVLAQMDTSGKPTVAIAEGVPEAELLAPPEFAGFHDPHVWMDVKMWLHTIDPVRDALIALDPDHAEQYRANAETYRANLQALESYVQQRVEELTPEQRILVTAHDAFNYFSKGYEFDVFAPQGISTETEASVEDIRQTIDVLVERNVPALFAESTISPDIINAVQEGARARDHEVVIAGPLYTDAMGEEGTPQGTYEGMIRFNIDTIVDALK